MLMEKRKKTTSVAYQEETLLDRAKDDPLAIMDISHIQRLTHLLDQSDIAEIELRRAEEGLHLVLRKRNTPGPSLPMHEDQYEGAGKQGAPVANLDQPTRDSHLHQLRAHMVGVFHPWLKSQSKALVAVGDLVKVGQVVGTIEALTISNEIETPVAGRVVEISLLNGQKVEYGQLLMTIDSSESKTVAGT